MTTLPSDSELGLFRDEPHLVIHHLMNLLEITNAELGNRLGITKQAAYKIRSGRSRLSTERAKRVADALGVPAVLLMTTPAVAIREVLNQIEADDGDGGPGGNVTPLWHASVGGAEKMVWQSLSDDFLPLAS